jgi:hypothetical protein
MINESQMTRTGEPIQMDRDALLAKSNSNRPYVVFINEASIKEQYPAKTKPNKYRTVTKILFSI